MLVTVRPRQRKILRRACSKKRKLNQIYLCVAIVEMLKDIIKVILNGADPVSKEPLHSTTSLIPNQWSPLRFPKKAVDHWTAESLSLPKTHANTPHFALSFRAQHQGFPESSLFFHFPVTSSFARHLPSFAPTRMSWLNPRQRALAPRLARR